jgi:hypothetical protein
MAFSYDFDQNFKKFEDVISSDSRVYNAKEAVHPLLSHTDTGQQQRQAQSAPATPIWSNRTESRRALAPAAAEEMGGDHGAGGGGDFRQKVWSMTGGPNCRPVHWRRNTAIAMLGVFLVCIPIAMKSAELEVPIHPISPSTIRRCPKPP